MLTYIASCHYHKVFKRDDVSGLPVFNHFSGYYVYDGVIEERWHCDSFDEIAREIGAKMFYAQHYGFAIEIIEDDSIIE